MRKFISIFSIILLLLSSVFLSNIFAAGSKGGHYEGGTGSSHKGGHYVNPATNNHYSNYGTGKGNSSTSSDGGYSSSSGNSASYGQHGSSSVSSGTKNRYKSSEFKPFYDQYSKSTEVHSGVKRDEKGRIIRSESAKEEFLKMKGFKEVPSGYQVDHIVPLYAGGRDDSSNMQLLTTQEHKVKTKADYNKY